MSRTRNFKPLFPTTGRMTLSVYQDLNNKYESNPQDLKVINNLIDVLQDYIFSVRDLIRFLYKGIIIKHNKTEPTYTKTSLFLCEKRRFFMARTEKGVVTTI